MSQFIEMFKGDFPIERWEECLSITNGKKYDGEYQQSGTYPICGSGGIMGYGDQKLCQGKTVILGRKGNINSPIFMESEYWIVDTAFCLEVDKQKLHPKYFYYWCKQFDFTRYNKQGVLPSLTKNDLLKIEMPIPPMELQVRFVNIIEQADKSEFVGFKSQFIEMFGATTTTVQIKDVCFVVSGKSIPTKLEDIQGNVPYIKVADFNLPGNEKYIASAQRYVAKESSEYSKMIPVGSVVFAKNGAASLSNKKRLTKIECCIDMNTMAIIPRSSEIMPEFLFAIIQAMDISAHVRQGAIPSISPKSIEDYSIVLPSTEEQNKYVTIVQQADKSEFELRKSIDAIDAVIKSLINS